MNGARLYIAAWRTLLDLPIEVYYKSESRKGSKANEADARAALKKYLMDIEKESDTLAAYDAAGSVLVSVRDGERVNYSLFH